jgi:cell division protein FtsB
MDSDISPPPPSSQEEGTGWLMWGTWLNLAVLLTLIIPVLFLKFRPPVQQEQTTQAAMQKQVDRRDARLAERDRLQLKLDLIRKDKEYLEVMARDRLQMQKDGELILRFEN